MKRRYVGKMFPYMMKMLVQKPDTIDYPHHHAHVAEHFRGALKFEQDKCIGCKLCTRVCPANAISIEKVPDEEKKYKAIVFMDKCIFCGQCVDSCPKKALHNSEDFELASMSRDKLRREI